MDLDELLSFKPLGKHSLEERDESRASKTSKSEGNGLTDQEKLLLLQNIDDVDEEPCKCVIVCCMHATDNPLTLPGPTVEVLDAGGVKRMLLSLEKKVLRNQEMRIKFPDLPEKFMESELELNDELQKLHIIATVPEYYPVLVETRVLATLLGLLGHDNTDISLTVVDLLQELTDVDTLSENQEEAEGLVDSLLSEQVLCVGSLCIVHDTHTHSGDCIAGD